MSDSTTVVRRALTTAVLAIEAVNSRGLKAAGTWLDYGRTFEGEKLPREAVGRTALVTLVESSDGKKRYVRRVELQPETPAEPVEAVLDVDEPSEAEASAPARADGPSPKALEYAKDLARKAGLADEDLDGILKLRFKRSLEAISKGECSMLISFLGGYRPGGPFRR